MPALQRRDELGELARAFNVFARNTASLEHTTRLLKEKTSQMEVDRIERQGAGGGAAAQPENEGGRATDGRAGA